MSPRDLEQEFLTTVSAWLASLPHDLKVLFEAKDEPNLDRAARELAAGAILYILNPESGDQGFARYADDAILLRAALREIGSKGGEGADDFRERFSDYYGSLDQDLEVCKKAMGEAYEWLAGKTTGLARMVYKGKKVPQYIDEDEHTELLYEDGLAFATDYPIDEEKLRMRLKKPETLLEPLRRMAAEEKKKKAV